jgi:hypothetical protein
MRLSIHQSFLSRLKSQATILTRESLMTQISKTLMDQILKLHAKTIKPHKHAIIEKFGFTERTFLQVYNLYTSLTFLTIFNELSLAKDEQGPTVVSVNSFVTTDSD